MIRAGKMPPPFPHKIAGVKHVKRIFKRFETGQDCDASQTQASDCKRGH